MSWVVKQLQFDGEGDDQTFNWVTLARYKTEQNAIAGWHRWELKRPGATIEYMPECEEL